MVIALLYKLERKITMVILKHVVEKIKELSEDLKYEWFVYSYQRKWTRLTSKRNG
ncbi:MAG: hypothetical protein ABII27_00600 [bacterium]